MNRRQSSRNFLQFDTPDRASCDVFVRCRDTAGPPTPEILAEFSFVANMTEGYGVVWGLSPEYDNALPPPGGEGIFATYPGGEGEPFGGGVITNLPGATQCPLRIEVYLEGSLYTAITLEWDEEQQQHGDPTTPVPVASIMVEGNGYTGLIRQLPCPA